MISDETESVELSRHDREDESLLAETLLNSRSASMSTIARSRPLIRSTIFMLVPVRRGHILAALIRHKISQSCRARAICIGLYWNIHLMHDNHPFMVSSVNIFPIYAFNILHRGNNCEPTISCMKETTTRDSREETKFSIINNKKKYWKGDERKFVII